MGRSWRWREWLYRWGEPAKQAVAIATLMFFVFGSVTWLNARKTKYAGVTVGTVCHRLDPPVSPNLRARDPVWAGRAEELNKYPVYLVEIQVHNAPQVDGLHLQVAGPAAAGWHLTSSALAPADGSAYAARLPTSSFPAGPDGFTAMPDLPTLPPGSWTTLRGIVYSSDEDMCYSEWVRATHATLRPVMLSENQRTMAYFMIGGGTVRAWATALAGLLALAWLRRRHLREAARAYRASSRAEAAARDPYRPES
jgi:hypothetical protein